MGEQLWQVPSFAVRHRGWWGYTVRVTAADGRPLMSGKVERRAGRVLLRGPDRRPVGEVRPCADAPVRAFEVAGADGAVLGTFRRCSESTQVEYELTGAGFVARSVEHETIAAGIVQALGIQTLGSTTFVDPATRAPLLRTMGGAKEGSHEVLVDDPRVDVRLAAGFVIAGTALALR